MSNTANYSAQTTTPILPTTMRAWQYTKSQSSNYISNLTLNSSIPLPTPTRNQHLIKIVYTSLNPIDYKPSQSTLSRLLLVPNRAIPGIDFSGIVIQPAANSDFQPGDKVFGVASSLYGGGCLAEYAIADVEKTLRIPENVSMRDAATIGVSGLTAWQNLAPYFNSETTKAKPKSILINGGSGGTGVFAIQLVKALAGEDVHVTTTCSTRNLSLCRSLGADEVIDYTSSPVLETLSSQSRKYDLVLDNVFTDPNLYYHADTYTTPEAKYIIVAASPSVSFFKKLFAMKIWPAMLGGGKRSVDAFFVNLGDRESLESMVELVRRGEVKSVVHQIFSIEDGKKAFEQLISGRARGKVVVQVSGEEER